MSLNGSNASSMVPNGTNDVLMNTANGAGTVPGLSQTPVSGSAQVKQPQQQQQAAETSLYQSLPPQHLASINAMKHVPGVQVAVNGNHGTSNGGGAVSSNQVYLNPNGVNPQNQVAAFAAAANAAQQVVQSHLGIGAQQPQVANANNTNASLQGSTLASQLIQNHSNVDHLNMSNPSMGNGNHQIPASSAPQLHPQIPLSAQAQAAAILAASSLGQNIIFNHGQNSSIPAIAAAQAFALLFQQQAHTNQQQQQQQQQQPLGLPNMQQVQQQQQQQQQQQPRQATPTPAPTPPQHSLQAVAHESLHQFQPKSDSQPTQTIQQQTLEQTSASPQRKRKQTQEPKKQQQNTGADKDKASTTVNLPSLQHGNQNHAVSSNAKHAQSIQQLKQLATSPFQMAGSIAPVHQVTPNQHNHNNLIQSAMNPIVLSQMQGWKLNQLESHAQLLRDTNQPIPQAVQVLLAEARKLEEKRAAKRIANRKSACTSRARKKALVAEMTKTNVRLRRQAVILSLLPDLVVAIKDDGTITFCSAQVERVLRHKVEDMVGANIGEVLIPSSRVALGALVEKLVAAEKAALEDNNNKEGDESGRSSNSGNTSGAAIVSEQSDHFPLSIVKVKSRKPDRSNDTSDSSGNGNNNVTDATMSRSATQSSLANQSNSDGSTNPKGHDGLAGSGSRKGNSDVDSSSSSDTKNLSEANEALNRNVRFHNEQLKIKKDSKKKGVAHKDDVTGDSVTANNADARLSSLMKQSGEVVQSGQEKKKGSSSNLDNLEDNSSSTSSDSLLAGVEDKHKKRKRADNNASDDSGYRESGESDPSREDSASSTSDTSNGRPRPLAPTCNICLIRDDLTTIWCEVTSSIRTRSEEEEEPDMLGSAVVGTSNQKKQKAASSNSEEQLSPTSISQRTQIKELLLCLRPIRDGVEKVSEDLRFVPNHKQGGIIEKKGSSNVEVNSNKAQNNSFKPEAINTQSQAESNLNRNRPMKKRQLSVSQADLSAKDEADENPAKRRGGIDSRDDKNDAEKSVVESLILMSSN